MHLLHPCPRPSHNGHWSQSSARPQTPAWLLQNLHTHLGSLCDPSSAILCHLPTSWPTTALIQALYALRDTALSPARPVLPLSYLLCASLPHQTHPPHPGTSGSPLLAPPNLCQLISATSSQHSLFRSKSAAPSSPLHFMSDSNLEQTPYLQTPSQSFSSHSAPNGLSLYQSPSPFFALCHPVLSYIPQCQRGCEGARLGTKQIRLESWLHHYVTVENDYPFERQYNGAVPSSELWGALHKHGAESGGPKGSLHLYRVVTTSPHPKAGSIVPSPHFL